MRRMGGMNGIMSMLRLVGLFWLFAIVPAAAMENAPVEAFFGEYEGTATVTEGDDAGERQARVEISKHKSGFSIEWETVIADDSGDSKTRSFETTFMPDDRDNLYISLVKGSMFEGKKARNPLNGEPLLWATIKGKTLSVYNMVVTDDASYEISAYHRTLTDVGLDIAFSRIVGEVVTRRVTGSLKRVSD